MPDEEYEFTYRFGEKDLDPIYQGLEICNLLLKIANELRRIRISLEEKKNE